MPRTVKARLLLGWMSRKEAVSLLKNCYIDNKPLTDRKAFKLWKHYREKVDNLEPRNCAALEELPLTEAECQAAQTHLANLANLQPQVALNQRVIKVHPANLILRQFHVVTERSETYGQSIVDEQTRINHCFGIGLNFTGQLTSRLLNQRFMVVDLPHFEYTIQFNPQKGIIALEWTRYISVFRAAPTRTVLWGGYHRTYALLCQLGGDGCGGAPLFTTVTGMAEVNAFMVQPSFARDAVLGDRPALLRDFLDDELFIEVNLRKRRAQGYAQIDQQNQVRWGMRLVDDDS